MSQSNGGPADIPLRKLSELSGLSPILIRAWERRYGFPAPIHRTAGGHRRYTREEVEMVRHAALLTRSGLRAADAIARAREGVPLPAPAGELSAAELAELLLDADTGRALDFLRGATVAAGFETTLEEMAIPALQLVGRRWAEGTASVAEEHVATGVVSSWLGSVRASQPPVNAGSPAYLLATPEGEEHGIAVWALELLLQRRGVPVRALGAEVPLPDLVGEAGRPGVRGVVLSVSRAVVRRTVARYAAALRTAHPGVRIFAGGAAATPPPAGTEAAPATLTGTADLLAAIASDR